MNRTKLSLAIQAIASVETYEDAQFKAIWSKVYRHFMAVAGE